MKKNIIRLGLITAFVVGAFLVLNSSESGPSKNECKESMDECCQKPKVKDNAIWDLSAQFFTSTGLN